MKNILNNKWIVIIGVLIIGILVGKFIFGGNNSENEQTNKRANETTEQPITWTCSMHPQIQQDKQGQCPLCGMDLIPLDNSMDNDETLPDEVPMSASAMKLAEIQTYIVKKEKPQKEIRLLGKVKPDERKQYAQVAHLSGRIEKLYINYTGEKVRKGQKLASIYSPEFVTAQKELLQVLNDESISPALVNAAREKIKQWKFTDAQIKAIEKSGKVQTNVDVLSNYNGYVMKKLVDDGDHVKEGESLFKITDLSRVWVLFEAYENELPWIKKGDKIAIKIKGMGGEELIEKVSFIDPFIDPKTRVAYVRVEVSNKKGKLKPEMFANGIIKSELNVNEDALLVPKSAVLWTGKRAVVYVKLPNREHNSFIYREIILGENVGEFYVVNSGLEEGEEIATNGVFKIDASAQLAGKKSMMNPTGGKQAKAGHAGMDMGGDGDKNEMSSMDMEKEVMIDKSKIPSKFKKQLGEVVVAYLPLKDKFTQDDNNINSDIHNIQKALKKVDMSLVMEDAHNAWMDALKTMNKELKLLSKAVNIEEQRTIFLTLSKSLSDVSQQLGVKMEDNKTLYLEFCPMADDNNGGFWLSTEKEIKNPYFGAKMLKCGSVKETLTKK